MKSRYRLPTAPPTPPTGCGAEYGPGDWPPVWLKRAAAEALDHFMLMSEVGDRWCVYCGEPSAHADHLVPLPTSGQALRPWVPTVPACASCNGTLRDFYSPMIVARAGHIAMHLRRRGRVRRIEDLEQEVAAADRPDFWQRSDLLYRLYHLDHGGLLRSVRDRHMPPPNLDFSAVDRI